MRDNATTIEDLKGQKQSIKNELADAAHPFNDRIQAVETKIQAAYFKEFVANEDLNKAISELESSGQYTIDEFSELSRFIHFDLSQFKESDSLQYLEEYLQDQCIYINTEYETLQMSEGSYIGIKEDGEVYHSDCGSADFFLTRDSYESIEDRNAQIEAYMGKSGEFPSVFEIDHYGNLTLISTISKKASAEK